MSKLHQLASLAVLLGTLSTATAQSLWVNTTNSGTNWSTASNWNPAAVPASGTSTALVFGTVPQILPPTTATYQPVGAYTSTNDNSAAFVLNSMTFNGFGACDTSTAANNGIVITSSIATGGISFLGTSPTITQNGTGSVLFADGTATSDIVLNAPGLTINGNGIGHIVFNGAITGSGGLTINHTGTTPLFSGGQVFLTPTSTNTFTGGISLQAGNLTIGSTSSPLGNAGNLLTVTGGTLRATAAATVPNPVAVAPGSAFTLTGTSSLTFTNVVSGSGDIANSGSASIITTFQNTVNTTGTLKVAGLAAAFPRITFSSQNLSVHGTATSASAYNIYGGSILLDNTTANVTRLNANATLNLYNSAVLITGAASATTVETVSTTNMEGGIAFTLTPTSSGSVSFNGGVLNRSNNATFVVNTTGAGLTLGGPQTAIGNASLIFTNPSALPNTNGVLPFAAAFIQNGTGTASTLVRYDVNNGVVPLNFAADYVTSNPKLGLNNPQANYRVPSTANSFGGVNGTFNVNSLLLETASGATVGGALYGGGTFNLTSGVLMSSLVGGTTQPTVLSAVLAQNINLGATGYFYATANLTLLGNIAGTNGLVIHGAAGTGAAGSIRLTGNNSGLFGVLSVNSGNLFFSNDANLGAPGAGITLGVAQGSGLLSFTPTNQFESASTPNVIVNRPITILGGGGGFVVGFTNNTLTLPGTITGSGRLLKTGAGTLVLAGTNTFLGDITAIQGTIAITSDTALGDTSNSIGLSAATLQFNGNITTNRNVLLTGAGTLFTNGNSVTMFGNIGGSQTATAFTKAGNGSLTLRFGNSVNGAVTLGDATVTRRPGAAFAQPGGTLVLAGANGALAEATGYTLNLGTMLHLDNTLAVNTNRVASKQIALNGATLLMTGNAAADTFEHVGLSSTAGLTSNSLGNTVTITQPNSGGLNLSTTLIATSFNTTVTPGLVHFRGDNLGGASGDRTALIFVAAPALTNGILAQAFFSGSATAAPEDFATTATTGVGTAVSVVRFTAYTPLPATGSVATTNYSHTGTLTFTGGAHDANGLKLANGTINLAGLNLTLSNAAMLLSTGTDAITTTSGTPSISSLTPFRISVNGTLDIGTAANPVNVTTATTLMKTGPGTLSLSQVTTIPSFNIFQGTLKLLTANAFVAGSFVQIQPGATFDINSLGTPASPIGAFALGGFGTVNLGSGSLSTGVSAGNTVFGGSFTGTGTLIHAGSTSQTLNGNSPLFSGDVRVINGVSTSITSGLIIDANVVPTDTTNPGPLGTGTSPILLGDTSGTNQANIVLSLNVNRFERDITVQGGGTGIVGITGSNANTVTITSNIVTNSARNLRLALGSFALGTGSYTFTGQISGNGAVQAFGGQIAFWGNNSYSGGTFLEISADGNSTFGVGHDSAFGTGLVRYAVNFPDTVALRADGGQRIIGNAMTIENTGTAIVIGYVGQNILKFTGSFNINTTATTGLTRTFNVMTRNDAFVEMDGVLSETGAGTAINKTGTGTLILAGQNTYSGGTTLTEGVLAVGSSSTGAVSGPLGTGTFTIAGGTFRAVGGGQTVANPVTVTANYAIDGMNDIIMGGATSIGSAVRRITITNSGATTFSNTISSGPGGGIEVEGTGLLVLSGSNSYAGGTTVMGGKLRVKNTTGSGTGTGAVGVMSGATLEGTGSIGGDIAIAPGGTLAGGESNSPNQGKLTQTSGTLTLAAGARMLVGVHNGTTISPLNMGLSTLDANSNNFFEKTGGGLATIDPNALIFVDATNAGTFSNFDTNYSYKIAQISGMTGNVTIPDGNITITFANGQSATGKSVFFDSSTGFVYLNFTPVPEPTVLIGVALLICAVRRKRAA